MHHLHTGRSPSYLADVVEPVSKKSTRHLRSTDSNFLGGLSSCH